MSVAGKLSIIPNCPLSTRTFSSNGNDISTIPSSLKEKWYLVEPGTLPPKNIWCGSFLVVNHHNLRNWVPSILTHILRQIFMGMRQKNLTQKRSISSSANSQYFFPKISWIGPWVNRIDWCEWHWYGSSYMAVRLSDRQPGKKCIFCVFWPFLTLCRPASRPHGLSKINALCINQFY